MQNYIETQEGKNLLKQNFCQMPKTKRSLPIRFVDNKSVNLYSTSNYKSVHNEEGIHSMHIVFLKPVAVLRTSSGLSLGEIVEVESANTPKLPSLNFNALRPKIGFRCVFCNYITKTKNDFIKHVKIHHNCGPKDLENHQKLRRHNASTAIHLCNSDNCVAMTTDVPEKTLYKDTKTSTPETASINIIVGTNGQIQSTDTSLRQFSQSSPENETKDSFAIIESLNDLKFVCLECFKEFNCHIAVRRHNKKSHTEDRNFKCQHCTATFKHKNNLDYHMAKHKNHRPFKCGECSKSFAVKYELVIHMRKHTGEKPYSCNICRKDFRHRCNLIVHQRLHSGTKRYKCNICNSNFNSSSHFKRHKKHHLINAKNENELNIKEHLSKPKTTEVNDLIFIPKETHFNLGTSKASGIHLDEKNQPHIQNTPSILCSNLTDDIRTQQVNVAAISKKEKLFNDILNISADKSNQTISPTSGTGESREADIRKIASKFMYKFQCAICFRYFKQKCALTRHNRTHTGEKPYNCAWCDKSFADPSNFKKHKFTHIRDALYKRQENKYIEPPVWYDTGKSPLKYDLRLKCYSQTKSYNLKLFSTSYEVDKNARISSNYITNYNKDDNLTTSKGPLIIWPDLKSNKVQPDIFAEIEKNDQSLLKN